MVGSWVAGIMPRPHPPFVGNLTWTSEAHKLDTPNRSPEPATVDASAPTGGEAMNYAKKDSRPLFLPISFSSFLERVTGTRYNPTLS